MLFVVVVVVVEDVLIELVELELEFEEGESFDMELFEDIDLFGDIATKLKELLWLLLLREEGNEFL